MKYLPTIVTTAAFILMVISLFSAHQKNIVRAENLNCRSIGTFEDAQRLYKSNPVAYKGLDADHDGIACESLMKYHE